MLHASIANCYVLVLLFSSFQILPPTDSAFNAAVIQRTRAINFPAKLPCRISHNFYSLSLSLSPFRVCIVAVIYLLVKKALENDVFVTI
jgi:hypothetical protein